MKDGNVEHITREPEQVKAFRDTWRDGIHSYLTYLRDRLTVARDLLTDSGSIFVQIGDENVHRVRALMDEIFGENNFISSNYCSQNQPAWCQASPQKLGLHRVVCEVMDTLKYRQLYSERVSKQVRWHRLSDKELPGEKLIASPKTILPIPMRCPRGRGSFDTTI